MHTQHIQASEEPLTIDGDVLKKIDKAVCDVFEAFQLPLLFQYPQTFNQYVNTWFDNLFSISSFSRKRNQALERFVQSIGTYLNDHQKLETLT
jgi:hypothetical protein